MTAQGFALVAAPFASILIFVGTILWERRRDRNRPAVDEAQVKNYVNKTNRWRDARLAQYDRYYDEQDLPWHRAIERLLHQAKDNGGVIPADAVIPPTPVLPDPPPYD